MIDTLAVIKYELQTELGLNYAFDVWNKQVQLPYYVGEISESPNQYEDGSRKFDFILTGTDKGSYAKLFIASQAIQKRYREGYKMNYNNKLIEISYGNMITVPVEVEDLKRIQINLSVTLWESE